MISEVMGDDVCKKILMVWIMRHILFLPSFQAISQTGHWTRMENHTLR